MVTSSPPPHDDMVSTEPYSPLVQWLSPEQLPGIAKLYPWHQDSWQRVTGRYPDMGHALLMAGKTGCGKQAFAAYLVRWLLCHQKQPDDACGHCTSCHWLAAGSHPDLLLVTPELDEKKRRFGAIRVDQIRQVTEFVQHTGDGHRVVVINYADQLNHAAANALLKTLEEPGEQVVILLIAQSSLRLAPTICSRVQQLALDRIAMNQALGYVENQLLRQQRSDGVEADQHVSLSPEMSNQLRIALQLMQWMPLAAIDLLQQPGFASRAQLLSDWLQLVQRKHAPLQFAQRWLRLLDLESLRQIMAWHIQDLLSYKVQQPVRQSDLDWQALADQYELADLFKIWQYLLQIPQMQLQNVQSQLIADQLAMLLMNVRVTLAMN